MYFVVNEIAYQADTLTLIRDNDYTSVTLSDSENGKCKYVLYFTNNF